MVARVETLATIVQVDSWGSTLLDVVVHGIRAEGRSKRMSCALKLVEQRVDSVLDGAM